MRIEWSVFAISDREMIFDYIETESPQNALLVDERIQSQVEILTRFPESGRPGRINGTREFIVEHTPFIVTYVIQDDVVRILRVRGATMAGCHAAQLTGNFLDDGGLVDGWHLPFPLCHDNRCQAVADDVDGGAPHVHQLIDTQ